jgi:hypothetical protein
MSIQEKKWTDEALPLPERKRLLQEDLSRFSQKRLEPRTDRAVADQDASKAAPSRPAEAACALPTRTWNS